MKLRRLEALPLTPQDEGIWALVIERGAIRDRFGMCNLFHVSEHSDRCDAALMFTLELCRSGPIGHPKPAGYPNWPMVMTLMRGAEWERKSFP